MIFIKVSEYVKVVYSFSKYICCNKSKIIMHNA